MVLLGDSLLMMHCLMAPSKESDKTPAIFRRVIMAWDLRLRLVGDFIPESRRFLVNLELGDVTFSLNCPFFGAKPDKQKSTFWRNT